MSYFRIYIYLKIKYFFLSVFYRNNLSSSKFDILFKKFTKKNKTLFVGQLRVGFYLVLKYLKKKFPEKREIILNSYNLAEMVNICKNLNLKLIFVKLNKNIYLSAEDVEKKINRNTLAVVGTNIFNTFEDIRNIKTICKKKKIPFIEDNAIYFGNFTGKNKQKYYAGSFGDYSLHSFNIMKSLSAMYGGSVSTNDKQFINFARHEILTFKKFPLIKYLKQCIIYFILKLLSINFFYKALFLKIIKKAHENDNKFILSLIYPSLKFKKKKLSNNFCTKISELSKTMVKLQLNNINNINLNHSIKKSNNIYYDKLFNRLKISNLRIINLKDSNFQNFNDYPIIVTNKKKLVMYLLDQDIETKAIQYVDCQKIFNNQNKLKLYEYQDKILCLPNHSKITKKYIDLIVYKIYNFYKKNS